MAAASLGDVWFYTSSAEHSGGSTGDGTGTRSLSLINFQKSAFEESGSLGAWEGARSRVYVFIYARVAEGGLFRRFCCIYMLRVERH